MKYGVNSLAVAVGLALAGALVSTAAAAQTQQRATDPPQTSATPSSQPKRLQTVQVTGSLIQRTSIETASPVISLSRAHISNTGALTLGSVLQNLPSVAGDAINPQTTGNGGGVANASSRGGSGAARLSLRGLGTGRTLLLINGQRVVNPDLNIIPQSMIRSVQTLAEGASTTYGSDAIGGVVNLITRKHFSGVQLQLNDGMTGRGDGKVQGGNLILGRSGSNYNVIAGLGYNDNGTVKSLNRKWAAQSYSLINGEVVPASGSTFTPRGRIQVPPTLKSRFGCGFVRLAPGKGDGTSLNDYECFTTADTYNKFPEFGRLVTHSIRKNAFLIASEQFTPNVTGFVNLFFNKLKSQGLNAPDPAYVGGGWNVPADAPFNPFGVTYSATVLPGQPNSGFSYRTRIAGGLERVNFYHNNTVQLLAGLRGAFGDSSWLWNFTIDYGHFTRGQIDKNEVTITGIQSAIDSGFNIFNQVNEVGELSKITANPTYTRRNLLRSIEFTTSGNLWKLPAGIMKASVGADYREQSYHFVVDPIAVLNTETLTCEIAQEGCATSSGGSDNVKELFGETLIPVLSHEPWAYSLKVDLGARISRDKLVGVNSTNKKVAIQWRPVRGLLVRGTVSQVFRAPTLTMQWEGASLSQPGLVDPCVDLSAAQLAQHPKACAFVKPGFNGLAENQVNAISIGSQLVNAHLKPEHGKSMDFGMVYDPSWLPGANVSVDFWHVYLYNTLVNISPQLILNQCFNNNSSPYCSLIVRFDDSTKQPGVIFKLNAPTVNLGSLSTSGIDTTINYDVPHFDIGDLDPGKFALNFRSSYLSTFKNSPTPGLPGATTQRYAGTFNNQFGNIARWRATFIVNWQRDNWNVQWTSRYISAVRALDADIVTGASWPNASVVYDALQVGYAVPTIGTRFAFGVNNLSNRNPPFAPGGRGNNYDVVGRFFWGRMTTKF